MSALFYFLSMAGVTVSKSAIAVIASLGAMGVAAIKIQFDSEKEKSRQERIKKQYDKMQTDKKEIELKLFDKQQQAANEAIKKQYDQMQVDKKARELEAYLLVEAECSKYPYRGIKPPEMADLLLGYNSKAEPVWGKATNYIVAGTTGAGKTRKLYPLIMNFLAAQQGTLFLGDLKGTDFFMFKNKRYVVKYVNELEQAAELIKAFEAEYEARKQLFAAGGYIDLADYNQRAEQKLRYFMLVIDEYADIADSFHDRNGRPVGIYKDLVSLARKVRSFGGRIILGTQRPDSTVICGQLKNNCSVIGLQCVNTISSNVMVGCEGCERLKQTEALTVINGKLTKIFAYQIENERLESYLSKLK